MSSPDSTYGKLVDKTENNDSVGEAYMIVGTAQVLLHGRTFKLEIRRTAKGSTAPPYHVMTYERMDMFRCPNGTVTSEHHGDSVRFHVWVEDLNLPTYSFHRDSADDALAVAMELLTSRRNNENTPWCNS